MSAHLELKSVGDLMGKDFFIPHYQRGYRWTEHQVRDLLNDIWDFTKRNSREDEKFYCLQPVVVKKLWREGNTASIRWEVVDGQQRLTTLYLILSYLLNAEEGVSNGQNDELFRIEYETRTDSQSFLRNIKEDTTNIDYYYMWHAHRVIDEWFAASENIQTVADKMLFLETLLGKNKNGKSVKVIWYQTEGHLDSRELFIRLNMGKIPLTNSELIKALFLSETSFEAAGYVQSEVVKKRFEISLMWDEIEQSLNDGRFWAFITNKPVDQYPSRIELLLDLISEKKDGNEDDYHTFLYFLGKIKSKPGELWEQWVEIERVYRILWEWFGDRDWYHKAGYLVAVGNDLKELIDKAKVYPKDKLEAFLDDKIRKSVEVDLDEIRYDNESGYNSLKQVLRLFNVETIRTNKNITDFYPFHLDKSTQWSLEHIHAQNSEGLDRTKRIQWNTWLRKHKEILAQFQKNTTEKEVKHRYGELVSRIDHLDNDQLTWEAFNALSHDIVQVFSEVMDSWEDMHHISNIALISQPENAVLNNSVFEVKRREIIRMDRDGLYIPICTRRVFFKYYTEDSSGEQIYYWSHDDRRNYVDKIREMLGNYLPGPVKEEME